MSKKYVRAIIKDLSKFDGDNAMITEETDVMQLNSVLSELKDVLKINDDLPALSAPQIGENIRAFCIKFSPKDIEVFLNPGIMKHDGGMILSRESNASIPDKEFLIPRYKKVYVQYQNEVGTVCSVLLEDASACICQQMIDLLNGITLEDYGLEIIKEFDEATDEEREEVIKYYLEQLQKLSNDLREEINNNPTMLQFDKAIDFMTAKALGEVDVEEVELTKEQYDELADIRESMFKDKKETKKKRGRPKKSTLDK